MRGVYAAAGFHLGWGEIGAVGEIEVFWVLGWFCDKRGGYWGLSVSFCWLEVGVGEHCFW